MAVLLLTSKEKERTRLINDTRNVTVDGISGWPYSSWYLIRFPMFDKKNMSCYSYKANNYVPLYQPNATVPSFGNLFITFLNGIEFYLDF